MPAPPYTVTPKILDLLAQIAEEVGRLGLSEGTPTPPRLRRSNRIKSIHASLAIENNTLSLRQKVCPLAALIRPIFTHLR